MSRIAAAVGLSALLGAACTFDYQGAIGSSTGAGAAGGPASSSASSAGTGGGGAAASSGSASSSTASSSTSASSGTGASCTSGETHGVPPANATDTNGISSHPSWGRSTGGCAGGVPNLAGDVDSNDTLEACVILKPSSTNQLSKKLVATEFPGQAPAGATVTGITFVVRKGSNSGGQISDGESYVVHPNGTHYPVTGSVIDWPAMSYVNAVYALTPPAGAFTPDQANQAGFAISAMYGGSSTSTARIDQIQLIIDYTCP